MSKFTLGQRQFPTLGLRSQQPKNYVGPTLSCYLGDISKRGYSADTVELTEEIHFVPSNSNLTK